MTSKANRRGQIRKARVHRAARRAATTPQRLAINAQKRAEGHPGWVEHFNPNTRHGRMILKLLAEEDDDQF